MDLIHFFTSFEKNDLWFSSDNLNIDGLIYRPASFVDSLLIEVIIIEVILILIMQQLLIF